MTNQINAIETPKKKPILEAKKEVSLTEKKTKIATVLDLLRQKDGATIEDIVKVTGWQKHTARGTLSNTIVIPIKNHPFVQTKKPQRSDRFCL